MNPHKPFQMEVTGKKIYVPMEIAMHIAKFLLPQAILALDTCTRAIDGKLMNALRAAVRFTKGLYLRMLAPPTHYKLYPHIEPYVAPYVRDGILCHTKIVRLMPLNMKPPKPPPFKLPCKHCYPVLSSPRIIWTKSVQKYFATALMAHPAEPHAYRHRFDPKEADEFENNFYQHCPERLPND